MDVFTARFRRAVVYLARFRRAIFVFSADTSWCIVSSACFRRDFVSLVRFARVTFSAARGNRPRKGLFIVAH